MSSPAAKVAASASQPRENMHRKRKTADSALAITKEKIKIHYAERRSVDGEW